MFEKNEFVKPEIEIIIFDTQDIITTSGTEDDGEMDWDE